MVSLLNNAVGLRALLRTLGGQAAATIEQLLTTTSDPALLIELYSALAEQFADASADMTAQWYTDLAPQVPFEAKPAPPPGLQQLAADVRWALSRPDPGAALSGSVERHVFTASRTTVISNARREGVRYARLAQPDACPWCRIIATNPPHFRSEETATKGHTSCHCTAVAVRAGQTWSPPDYVADWRRQYNAAVAKLGNTQDIDELAKLMRPEQYAEVKDTLNARRRELYAQKKAVAAPKTVQQRINAASSWTELAGVLQKAHGSKALFDGLMPSGANKIDIAIGRDYASAINDMLTKYPDVKVNEFKLNLRSRVPGFADGELNKTYAWVRPSWNRSSDELVLNATKYTTNAALNRSFDLTVKTGYHPKGKAGQAAYSITVHEFGHALDNNGGTLARNYMGERLHALFERTEGFSSPQRGNDDYEKAFKKFLKSNMSDYSFKNGFLNPAEALAEAFADAEINGAAATVTSKELHKLLVEVYEGKFP